MERTPPYSEDAERAVLCACMLSKEALEKTCEKLTPEMFYKSQYQSLFSLLLNMYENRIEIDLLTIEDSAKKGKKIKLIGGMSSVAGIMNESASPANVDFYADIVLEKYRLRSIINSCVSITNRAYDDNESAEKIINELNSSIDRIIESVYRRGFITIRDTLNKTIDIIERRNKAEYVTGIPTGFNSINKLTSGWQKTDVIVIGAQKGAGKSSLAIAHAIEAARCGYPVGIFSLEMSEILITERFISREARVETTSAHYKKLTQEEWDKLTKACNRIYNMANIIIDSTPSINIETLKGKARRMKKLFKIEMLIVDYIQLLSGKNEESRQREIENISHGIKSLAMELDIPIIAVSQLARNINTDGTNKPPTMNQLRGSGAIEADASIILLMHDPEIQKKKEMINSYDVYWDAEEDEDKYEHIRALICEKNRQGKTGTIPIFWRGEHFNFTDIEFHYFEEGENAKT